jgi:hypothetical protein
MKYICSPPLQKVAVRSKKELVGEIPNVLHNPIILNQDNLMPKFLFKNILKGLSHQLSLA